MFTGIIEATGRVAWTRRRSGGAALRVSAAFACDLEVGESVCVNGVCQTVIRSDRQGFEVDVVDQTLSVSTLGELRGGETVNLERALRVGDRMGGHMVTGHVDGVGTVVRTGAGLTSLTVAIPPELARYVVPRGSLAIDGVSLTVQEVRGAEVTVALIPETLRATKASGYRTGTRVNVETDIVAKHQEKLNEGLHAESERTSPTPGSGTLTEERLRELGFTE